MDLRDLKQEMPEIFETVKKDVRKILGRHRAGLRLGLAELEMYQGGFIGGMHFHPGTDIVMNITPLMIMLASKKDDLIIWAYTYHILLHEYIHSLGIIDERRCRIETINVSKETFKDESHPALILAKHGIGVFIPNLQIRYVPPERRPDGML
ncbi:MAG: hypothetical protein ACTSQR_06955, partial [Promethearchaeota archaeon]